VWLKIHRILVNAGPFVVLALGALLSLPETMVPQTLFPVFVTGLLAYWVFAAAIARRVAPLDTRTPASVAVVALGGCVLIATVLSPLPSRSLLAAGSILFGLVLFAAIVAWVVYHRSIALPFWLFVGTATSLSVLALPAIRWKEQFRLFRLPIYEPLIRLSERMSETVHANVLAGGLVIVLPVLLAAALAPPTTSGAPVIALLPTQTSQLRRALVAVLCASSFSMLVLTQSRAGYIAGIVGCLVVVGLMWTRKVRWLLVTLGIVAVIGLLFPSGRTLLHQMLQLQALGGIDARFEIWSDTVETVARLPLTGAGPGTFTAVIPILYDIHYDIQSFPHAHNLLLQIGYDVGIPGLIGYLAVVLIVLVIGVESLCIVRQRADQSHLYAIVSGGLGGVTAMQLHGVLDAVQWNTRLAFLTWLVFALIVSVCTLVLRSQPPSCGCTVSTDG
jgi:putative inorganic carbon (HCO3(-)) transporter